MGLNPHFSGHRGLWQDPKLRILGTWSCCPNAHPTRVAAAAGSCAGLGSWCLPAHVLLLLALLHVKKTVWGGGMRIFWSLGRKCHFHHSGAPCRPAILGSFVCSQSREATSSITFGVPSELSWEVGVLDALFVSVTAVIGCSHQSWFCVCIFKLTSQMDGRTDGC